MSGELHVCYSKYIPCVECFSQIYDIEIIMDLHFLRGTVGALWFARMKMFGGWLVLLAGEQAVLSQTIQGFIPKWLSF